MTSLRGSLEESSRRSSLLLSLRNVHRAFEAEVPVAVLKGCSLDLSQSEFVAVAGPSGSGKTTLLNVIGLLDRPTDGIYTFAGRDMTGARELERASIRCSMIGFVFQSFELLDHRTALENVELPLVYHNMASDARRALAASALERVGLGARMHSFPTTLSGGEKQRVAIARSVVTGPRLLLCDEPTGNLDDESTAAVLDLLEELHVGGLTILVVTHDPRVATRAQRELRMEKGRLVA